MGRGENLISTDPTIRGWFRKNQLKDKENLMKTNTHQQLARYLTTGAAIVVMMLNNAVASRAQA